MEPSETDEIAAELYLLPPARFVAARDELVREARAAGNPELARTLHSLRRPTRSAWLVNLLARHERAPMERLAALGRELREAQTRPDGSQVRRLSEQRQQMIADLVERARRRAAGAGLQPTDEVLSEVEATLRAAMVDLAAAFTTLSGRLVRPLSHSGFGPMPHVRAAPTSPASPLRAGVRTQERGSQASLRVVDESRPQTDEHPRRPVAGQEAGKQEAGKQEQDVRRAEADLAAAESAHWEREHDLADAAAAVEAVHDRLQWLDSQRMQARRGKVTAERRLAEARSAQRSAVRAVAEARRRLEAAESRLRSAGRPSAGRPPSGNGAS